MRRSHSIVLAGAGFLMVAGVAYANTQLAGDSYTRDDNAVVTTVSPELADAIDVSAVRVATRQGRRKTAKQEHNTGSTQPASRSVVPTAGDDSATSGSGSVGEVETEYEPQEPNEVEVDDD